MNSKTNKEEIYISQIKKTKRKASWKSGIAKAGLALALVGAFATGQYAEIRLGYRIMDPVSTLAFVAGFASHHFHKKANKDKGYADGTIKYINTKEHDEQALQKIEDKANSTNDKASAAQIASFFAACVAAKYLGIDSAVGKLACGFISVAGLASTYFHGTANKAKGYVEGIRDQYNKGKSSPER